MTGCCCWSWPRSINNEWRRPTTIFFCPAIFDPFWAKLVTSETNVLSQLFPKESIWYWLIGLLTFVNRSNKTLIIKKRKNGINKQTDRQTDIATYRLNRPSELIRSKFLRTLTSYRDGFQTIPIPCQGFLWLRW